MLVNVEMEPKFPAVRRWLEHSRGTDQSAVGLKIRAEPDAYNDRADGDDIPKQRVNRLDNDKSSKS
jgi:hypothetical protein